MKNTNERVEEVVHSLKSEIASLAGMLNGSLIPDSGQAHIANMKLDKILEHIEDLLAYGAEMKAEGKEEGVKAERERIAEDIAEKVVQGHFNADPITSIADYAQTLLPSRLTTPREDNQ